MLKFFNLLHPYLPPAKQLPLRCRCGKMLGHGSCQDAQMVGA
jgi:hypothetical protein